MSLQSKTKDGIFTVDIKLKDIINSGEKEKIVRLEIQPNVITPNLYSWISSIHLPGTGLVAVLCDECDSFINYAGSEFATSEGSDYGCINCLIIKCRYSIHKLLGNSKFRVSPKSLRDL